MTHVTPINVQDIWFKAQRWLCTGVQVPVSLLLAGIAALAPEILEAVQSVLAGSVVVWLASAIASLAAVSAAASRVMATPTVNRWLVRIGLGAVPRAQLAKV
ncbi:hypothetical protein ASF17_01835 [Frigoribacterium sp. Leaf263]|uniref:hypothetical protein n=1 Tax=Frigoribacterium sp. Leaf263 TaxID=1736313 RepID=UPI0006FC0E32|nr:hypothetical protein [Frigoribacterium sp. Leaf263]KQO84289.1 hypothetical protein ASF17_01835 [Frigoribacterium sp. Leaf263]